MHDNGCAAYRTVSCRTDEISDIITGVMWVDVSLPRYNSNIIGAHFASLPLCLLAIITICYRIYKKKNQSLVPGIVSQSILLLSF